MQDAATDDIKNLGIEDLRVQIEPFGKQAFRVRQLMRWLYAQPVGSFDEMSNLAKPVRRWLEERYRISRPAVHAIVQAVDGTRKFLTGLEDGKKIETVLIPADNRLTLCLSSQVGCGMGCTFCRTATMGLVRNLTVGEILNQAIAARRLLEPTERITNIVFMGMGEPLHNAEAVAKAVEILADDDAFNFPRRRITVSTVGHVPGIQKLAELGFSASLAVSLNATTDEVRSRIMPVNRRYPLDALLGALHAFPLGPKGKITMEYVLLRGVNDSMDDARRLCRLLASLPVKINLIQYNPFPGTPHEPTDLEGIQRFQAVLTDKGFLSRLRKSRGPDVMAACGQLATERE